MTHLDEQQSRSVVTEPHHSCTQRHEKGLSGQGVPSPSPQRCHPSCGRRAAPQAEGGTEVRAVDLGAGASTPATGSGSSCGSCPPPSTAGSLKLFFD